MSPARTCLAGLFVATVLGIPLLAQQAPNLGGSKQSPNAIFVPLKNAQTPDLPTSGRSGSLVTQRMPSTAVIEAQRVLLETLVQEVTALKTRVAALEAAAKERGVEQTSPPQPQPAPKKQ